MGETPEATVLRARGAWRLLNSRPGWRISLRRVYALLECGQIPSIMTHGSHNTSYSVSRDDLLKYAQSCEWGRRAGSAG